MDEKRRIPLVAGLGALVDPGLGLVYNGNFKKGIIVTISFLVAAALLILAGALKSFAVGLIVSSIILVARVYFIIHSFLQARKNGKAVLTRFNRWYVYLLYSLLSAGACFLIASLSPVKSFRVPTGGMEPAIEAGDYIIVDMDYYRRNDVRAGDIVVFQSPNDPANLYIKRCIALGGQTVEIRNGLAFVNGQRSLPSLLLRRVSKIKPRDFKDPRIYPVDAGNEDQYGPVTIPESQLFMLGVNRDNSLDSRYFGFVDRDAVLGRAAYVSWSHDFSRVGKTFQ